jgi:predicted nucleic acid-binding protein
VSDLPKVFLDTSVLISGALSKSDASPARKFFMLGSLRHVDLRVSTGVLSEADNVLSRIAGQRVAEVRSVLAENLDLGRVGVAAEPAAETVERCLAFTKYRPDARVVAAAVEIDCDVLVSEDKQHLLNNPDIGPPNTKLVVMGVQEALDWLRDRILSDIRETRKRT